MRKTEKTYLTYGIDIKEITAIKRYCQHLTEEEEHQLLSCAQSGNKWLATHIVYSIQNNISYDKLLSVIYIPITKNSFYAYQRETLVKFREFLIKNGRWCENHNDTVTPQ